MQQLQLEQDRFLRDRLLLNKLQQSREAKSIFQRETQKTLKTLEQAAIYDTNYYESKWQLQNLLINHPGNDQFQLSKTEFEINMMQLDYWFIQKKLQLSCEMKAREKPLKEKYEIWLLPQIRQMAETIQKDQPLVNVYHLILQLLEGEEVVAYRQLKHLLQNQSHLLSEEIKKDILQSLINFTIRQGNSGIKHFLGENLELYKLGLSQGWLMEYGILNDMVYISIVNIALRAEAATWCQQFMEEYAPFLPDKSRSDAQNLAQGLWYYATNQTDKALQEIQKVEFLNVYYQIQARVLMIKITFESFRNDDQYYELVHAQVTAFERYLRRNLKLPQQQKTALIHFTSLVRKMTKIIWDRERKHALKEEATQLIPLYNRGWILTQLS